MENINTNTNNNEEVQKLKEFQKGEEINIINKITLEYLMTKDQYEKMNKSTNEKLISKNDRKFYRRRILNLTRNMLINKSPDNLFPDVKKSFDNFMKTCVGYFKVIDEIDIIQNENENNKEDLDINIDNFLDEATIHELDKNDIISIEEANNLMMRSIKINNITMDKYLIKKTTVEKKQPNYPKQKNIDLKDPSLKNKGISKKNNINNN